MDLGFIGGQDGLSRLSEILTDSAALMRGGDMLVRPQDGLMRLRPWSDGSGDEITLTPLPRECGAPGTPTEIRGPLGNLIGYQCTYSDGGVLKTLSFQGDRVLPALVGIDFPAVKSLLYLPVSAVKDNAGGWWRPDKRYAVGGFGSGAITWNHQPKSDDPDVTQPAWVVDSLMPYHDTKANNRAATAADSARNFMTGKIGALPAPHCALWGALGGLKGVVRGRWVWESPGILCKEYPMSALQPYLSAASTVSIDATFGYTTLGSSDMSNDYATAGLIQTTTEAGTVTQYSIGTAGVTTPYTIKMRIAVYSTTGSYGTSNPRLDHVYSETVAAGETAGWRTLNTTWSQVASTKYYIQQFSEHADATPGMLWRYDSGLYAETANFDTSITSYSQSFPDPRGTNGIISNRRKMSYYWTYTPAASGNPWYHNLHQGGWN